MRAIKYILLISGIILITACAPWVSVIVAPDNFSDVKKQFDTFLFGSYNIDMDQAIYLDFQGPEPDLLINRIYTHPFAPGKTDYFIIPIPSGEHFIRSVYYTFGPEYDGYYPNYPLYFESYRWGWGFHRWRFYYYYPYPDTYYYYPARALPYPFLMNLDKGKIYYIGRFILTNNRFSVENRFDEDKNSLLASFQYNTNGYLELSRSEFSNLLK